MNFNIKQTDLFYIFVIWLFFMDFLKIRVCFFAEFK